MAEVKWIKLNVGMFDGASFKKIKKAKIGGESFRDKLTAVWFELMDFAGKCNAGGQLIESPEIPFSSIEDIAIMIDREVEELNLCMQYYITNRMVTVIDDVFSLTNWSKYQNEEGLEKIREQTRKRVAKHRENKKLLPCNDTCNVTVTLGNGIEEEKEIEKERDLDKEGEGEEKGASPASKLEAMGGILGQGVLMLTDEQKSDLLDKLSTDEFDIYCRKLSDYIINNPEKTFKSHYKTILKWVAEDRMKVKTW